MKVGDKSFSISTRGNYLYYISVEIIKETKTRWITRIIDWKCNWVLASGIHSFYKHNLLEVGYSHRRHPQKLVENIDTIVDKIKVDMKEEISKTAPTISKYTNKEIV